MNKIPGLASIPLLGTLFKSREERKNKTELIVLVTPEVTKPLEAGEQPPMPPMPREFLQQIVPTDKRSSNTPVEQPQEPVVAKQNAVTKAKGFFARKK
jgi:pilus assembly protein CpaC